MTSIFIGNYVYQSKIDVFWVIWETHLTPEALFSLSIIQNAINQLEDKREMNTLSMMYQRLHTLFHNELK